MKKRGLWAKGGGAAEKADQQIFRAIYELTEVEVDPKEDPKARTLVRRLVHDYRMEEELKDNAQAAARIMVDRLRRSPRCFASQFSVTLWREEAAATAAAHAPLELDAFVSYTGLHLYMAGDAQAHVASYTYDESLVGWSAVNSMLILTIVDDGAAGGPDGTAGQAALKNMLLRTQEATAMRVLLSRYADAVADEREKEKEAEKLQNAAARRQRSKSRTPGLPGNAGRDVTA